MVWVRSRASEQNMKMCRFQQKIQEPERSQKEWQKKKKKDTDINTSGVLESSDNDFKAVLRKYSNLWNKVKKEKPQQRNQSQQTNIKFLMGT